MEQPIFTAKAHVFHIDPQTKRSWLPVSQYAVNVNFYYDSGRSLYRIISVEDTKAIINSTITPNMTFTKTSQKFGQWSDIRANTVYGLGFNSEPELNKFIEKFQEVKEATRNAAQQKASQQNGVHSSNTSTLSQKQSNNIIAPPTNLGQSSNNSVANQNSNNLIDSDFSKDLIMSSSIKQPPAIHQRSQSLSGLQLSKSFMDSPKHCTKMGSQLFLPQTSAEAQLKYENDRLKLALAQSSSNAKKWEIELQTLKNNNTRLTNALQESTANVEEWKKQLSALKEENNKLRVKILELEASNGNLDALTEINKEIETLKNLNEKLEIQNEEKQKEIKALKLKVDEKKNNNLKSEINTSSNEFNIGNLNEKSKTDILSLSSRLADSVSELTNIHLELNNLLVP